MYFHCNFPAHICSVILIEHWHVLEIGTKDIVESNPLSFVSGLQIESWLVDISNQLGAWLI
jgi:hypothetical protein